MGSGALLLPIASRLKKQGSKVFCVDSDEHAISQVRQGLSSELPTGVRYVNDDFLTWSQGKKSSFDCIVMNPPFAATKSELRWMQISDTLHGVASRDRFMPLEAAFVCRAIELLRNQGRLLAVLPCSIIMSETTQWLRDALFRTGAIRFVHELPPRTFPNVESRMYLFVFDKGSRQRKITLFNHDLADPERLELWLGRTRFERLDFGYYRAADKLKLLLDNKRFGWKSLEDVADVFRGDMDSPEGPKNAVHTSDYSNGFWLPSERHKSTSAGLRIQRGDLLVRRVGRNCYKSFGRPVSLQGMPCSDCVLIVRPKESRNSTRLLFSLQVIGELSWSKSLIERGTGASYVSHESIRKIAVPMNLHECYPKTFEAFVAAQHRRSSKKSRRAVSYAAGRLDRIVNEAYG